MNWIRRSLAAALLFCMLLTQNIYAAPEMGQVYSFTNPLDAAEAFAGLLQNGERVMYINVPANFDYTLCYRYLSMLYRDAYVFEYIPTPVNAYVKIVYNDEEKHVMAEREAAALAETLIHEEMTEREKYQAIHTWLYESVEYDMHAALNQATERGDAFSAYGALIDGLAVCDGISAAFAMICRAAGLPCLYVASLEMNHSWNAVWYEGEVRYIDTTYTLTSREDTDYFMLTEEEMALDHSWDREMVYALTDALWDERYVSAYILNSIGGFFRGSDKGWELDRRPTRAEAAIMLVRFLGLEQEALENSGHMHMPFTDVNPNHAPYVGILYALGLTNGTSETTFSPDAEVQPRDYMTFMLRALGYKDREGDFAWATAIEDSLGLGVLDREDYDILMTDAFDRGRMADVSLSVLQAVDTEGVPLWQSLAEDGILSEKKFLEFFRNN